MPVIVKDEGEMLALPPDAQVDNTLIVTGDVLLAPATVMLINEVL